jgi:AmiR/NasT family two-component response regulator
MIITDIRLPDMDGMEAAAKIYAEDPLPIIVITAFHDPALIERAERNHVLAYLVKPIKQQDLEPAIAIAMSRFQEFRALRQETESLRQALEDRKLIERAKGIIMKRAQLDEAEAFRRLQKLARDKNLKLVEIARIVVTAEEAY